MARLNRWIAPWLPVLLLLLVAVGTASAADQAPVRILLLGDSTTIGSVCRRVEPEGLQLEDVIRVLLATDPELPPVEVINKGRDGEFIHGLLTGGRYGREIAGLGDFDYIFIRYGLNDLRKREDFDSNFPQDYHRLLDQLRKDFPKATLVPTTTIPYLKPEDDERLLTHIRQVATSEQLPLFDVYTPFKKALEAGPNTLNYRRYPLTNIPEEHHAWLHPFVRGDSVVVMDNRLDAHFGDLPGWYADRHPNPAGYHVIGDATAKFLAPRLRKK